MSIAVKLPALGESVVEGTVSRWLVSEGDRIEIDQTLCEVTTDKVDAEIPAPASGRIERILAQEGETVAVGTELVLLDPADPDAVPDDLMESATLAAPTLAPARSDAAASTLLEPARATPVARRLADEAHVDLGAINGSGPAGRVTKQDVVAHTTAAAPEASVSQPAAPEAERIRATSTPALPQLDLELESGDEVVPMTPKRRLIAAHMVYSKQTSPHVGTVAEVDLGRIVDLRRQHGQAFRSRHGIALTYLPFIAHALVRALREFPALNASVAEDAIVLRGNVHLSLAVETGTGLLAPVVRNADRLSLAGLALAIEDISDRARSKRLGPDKLRGGTFTLSNPGRAGNLYGFAIINQPQVGIVRMGELVKRPVVRPLYNERGEETGDAIVIRPMMHLALSYDHRAVDGQPANAFLHRLRVLLEEAAFEL